MGGPLVIPDYIEKRLRAAPPDGCGVVPGSTPVVAFGNPTVARVATLGLNPSRQEFLDRSGRELNGSRRRFETLTSLALVNLKTAPNESLLAVLTACNEYFNRNPYRAWFDQLDAILRAVHASYYDKTACHLDLVQWATDPTWNTLSNNARKTLLAADQSFFLDQLRRESIQLLLLNGSGVIRQVQQTLDRPLQEETFRVFVRSVTTRFFAGTIAGVPVVAWSTNLQSSFGVTNDLRAIIAERVAMLAKKATVGSGSPTIGS
jgi:hypothetical protein